MEFIDLNKCQNLSRYITQRGESFVITFHKSHRAKEMSVSKAVSYIIVEYNTPAAFCGQFSATIPGEIRSGKSVLSFI